MLKSALKTLRITCALALISITPAHALDHISDHINNPKPVGEGRLSVLMWDVYDATLYAPQGTWQQDKPFALKLSYLRDIEGKKIADRSIEEMRDQGENDEIKLAAWHTQMRRIFPNVTDQTSITGIYTMSGSTIFYANTQEIGRIQDPTFSRAFFNIWLSQDTSAPALRAKLLGTQ